MADESPETKKSSKRGGFVCNWIQPYLISSVDWANVPLDHNFHSFVSDVAEEEYIRFAHRDMINLLPAFTWSFGGPVLTVLTWANQNNLGKVFWFVAGPILLLLALFDWIIFAYFCSDAAQWTSRLARLRQTLRWLQWFVMAVSGGLLTFGNGQMCNDLSPSEQNTCVLNLYPIPMLTMTVGLAALRLKPIPAIIGNVAVVVMIYLGRLIASLPRQPGESAAALAVQILTYFFAAALGALVSVLQHNNSVQQFIQAVTVEIELRRAAFRQEEVDTLLRSMLPAVTLDRIMIGQTVRDQAEEASVLFSDIVQFTRWSSTRAPQLVVGMLNTLVMQFDDLLTKYEGVLQKIKTIGDAYWCVCGLPDTVESHADYTCHFAHGMISAVRAANLAHPEWQGIYIRVGVHCGSLQGAVLGSQALSYEVFGETNEIAEECEQHGRPGEVCVSEMVAAQLTYCDVDLEKPFATVGPPERRLRLYILPRPTEGSTVRLPTGTLLGGARADVDVPIDSSAGLELHQTHVNDGQLSIRSARTARSRRSNMSRRTEGSGEHAARLRLRRDHSHSLIAESAASYRKAADDRRKREAFLNERAQRAGAFLPSVDDLEKAESELNERRLPCCVLWFNANETESEFVEWGREKHALSRRLVGAILPVFSLWVVAVQPVTPGHPDYSRAWGPVLHALACVATAAAGVLAVFFHQHQTANVVTIALQYAALTFFVIAAWVTNSATLGSATWLLPLYSALIALGNGVSTFAGIGHFGFMLPAQLCSLMTRVLCLHPAQYGCGSLATQITYLGCELAFRQTWIHCLDVLLRREFLEFKVAQWYTKFRDGQAESQRNLLQAVVPSFAVPPLLAWLDAGMNPERSPVQDHSNISLLFFKCYWEGDADSRINALSEFHLTADTIVAQHAPHITKVKTVGNLIICAGPLDPSANAEAVSVAATALASVALELRRVVGVAGGSCRGGMHTGDVVAAVMGTVRLTFDVFGDAMNTCSRVMSTADPNELAVSDTFYETFSRNEQQHVSFAFSSPLERAAKGKKALVVRALQECKAVVSP